MSDVNKLSKLGDFLNKLNKEYHNNKNKSLTEIIQSFSQLTSEYNELNELNKSQIDNNYSSRNYTECSAIEQEEFFSDQLQFIETLVINSIYDKVGIIWNWGDIYNLMKDPTYKSVEKIQRKVIYSASSNQRPIGDMSYNTWNGLQIIDIDIKDAELAFNIKQMLFNELNKYHWFLGCCISASGKSCHVWTKITPISIDTDSRKTEYICNFRHKYSYIYIVLMKYASKFGYTKEDVFRYMDMAMCKPQQGIFISSDSNALINTNFIDLRLDVNFETALNTGVTSINWISHPDLKDIFHKLEWFQNDTSIDNQVEISNISGINDRDKNKSKGKKHYKHNQRWQLANTLTSIYGQDKALQIMYEICDGTPRRELQGDVKTAAIHNKPISTWAIKELNNNHGFKLKIKSDELYEKDMKKIEAEIANNAALDPTRILNDNSSTIYLTMNHNQYLSDIKDKIIANLAHITLLEAGAGYGKTEMIKSLKAKTLLILPFLDI